jgi:hypothetical protein
MAIFTACHDSQSIYRIMLMAMSHPGKRYTVAAPGNDCGGTMARPSHGNMFDGPRGDICLVGRLG